MVSKQTVTLANSIVGVSVLAMPFCFKQCGILLATLILMIGAVITRTVCYFLLKAGLITRRRTYEMLAWDTFGQGGKFIVEISIIGFLVGTLIAFFVVMGDLGPEIITEIFDIDNNKSLRIIIMAALGLFVALPLGLLRNIDSLSMVSSASVLFYVFLVCKILSEGIGPLFTGSYLDRIDYWRPAGVMQCIPIFSMALSCQTQIFGIYESLPDPTLQKMNEIVKQAVNICTVFYFCVGFFGYIAFCHQSFGGNILMSFSSSWSTQLIKTCFLMSIVFSVPLVVFPCRASLHSLIFKRVNMHHSLHDASTNYIPEIRLNILTVGIIGFTLVVGILIPNIELVLGLVGSTTGTVICIIFPSIMFIRVTSKQTTERLLAQALFFTGVVMMVVSTYATLYAVDQATNDPIPDQLRVTEVIRAIKLGEQSNSQLLEREKTEDVLGKVIEPVKFEKFESKNIVKQSVISSPKIPVIREDHVNEIEVAAQAPVKVKDADNSRIRTSELEEKKEVKPVMPNENIIKSPAVIDFEPQGPPKPQDSFNKQSSNVDNEETKRQNNTQEQGLKDLYKEPVQIKALPPSEAIEKKSVSNLDQKKDEELISNNNEKKDIVEKDVAAVLLQKLEQHEENQKKFLAEQRQVLAELKEHHAQDVQKQKEEDIKVQIKNSQEQPGLELEKPEQDKVKAEGKEEVAKQEKIIEKLSENIEKEMQNVKLIEKLEEGLNKEIKKSDTESKFVDQNEINIPAVPASDPIASKQAGLQNQSREARKVIESPPAVLAVADLPPPVNAIPPDKVLLKPIPIQHSENLIKDIKNPVIVNAAGKVQMSEQKQDAPQELTMQNPKLENPADQKVETKVPDEKTANKPEVKKSAEQVKQIDRDM